jgi:hypothetical protein
LPPPTAFFCLGKGFAHFFALQKKAKQPRQKKPQSGAEGFASAEQKNEQTTLAISEKTVFFNLVVVYE